MGTTVTPDTGALDLTGQAPQVNSGPMATPDAGGLQLTGLAPVIGVDRSYLVHRIVVTAPGSAFTPGDPDPLPDTDFWITSRRGNFHNWIAQAGEGAEAGPDISLGGQRLELPLGRSTDGEVQIRLIDVAAPLAEVACDINSVLVPEGDADLHLDSTAFSSGKWVTKGSYVSTEPPWADWGVNADGPLLGTFALFGWGDPGPWVRSTWIEATFDGTEGTGAWTPGQIVGFRFRYNWTLDTGGGNVFVELQGAGDPVRVSAPTGAFDLWSIPEDPLNQQVDMVVYAVADASGEVIVRLGAENMFPSFNLVVGFTDMEIVECDTVVVGSDAERYITSWLADSAARQQLLGRPAYLEESTDGGTTWSRVLYRGYLKQITLDQSLTYLLTLGDAGRGRRVSKAWTGLNPVEEFAV